MNSMGAITDWDNVASELAPIQADSRPARLRRMSQDYYWFSPILRETLEGVVGDLIVSPENEAELLRVVGYCARNRLALTPRGGGTGNYGQSMPVAGGLVLDTRLLAEVMWIKGGAVRAGGGIKLKTLDAHLRPHGMELRFHPSTWAAATLGGFLAGGTAGCGSVNYGTVHDPGNVLGLRLVTMEEEPRILELRGSDIPKAIHAYGTTGVILEAELALAPARNWIDFVVAFPSLEAALGTARALGGMPGIEKKQLAVVGSEIAANFTALKAALAQPMPLLLTMIAESSADAFGELIANAGGQVVFDRRSSTERVPPIYEYCWNHTTLLAINADRGNTYLQVQFPGSDPEQMILEFDRRFEGEATTHIEYLRIGHELRCSGLPVVRYRTKARLNEIIAAYREAGCTVRDPHSFTLDRGPDHGPRPLHRQFKALTDPLGLLNPGKMPPA